MSQVELQRVQTVIAVLFSALLVSVVWSINGDAHPTGLLAIACGVAFVWAHVAVTPSGIFLAEFVDQFARGEVQDVLVMGDTIQKQFDVALPAEGAFISITQNRIILAVAAFVMIIYAASHNIGMTTGFLLFAVLACWAFSRRRAFLWLPIATAALFLNLLFAHHNGFRILSVALFLLFYSTYRQSLISWASSRDPRPLAGGFAGTVLPFLVFLSVFGAAAFLFPDQSMQQTLENTRSTLARKLADQSVVQKIRESLNKVVPSHSHAPVQTNSGVGHTRKSQGPSNANSGPTTPGAQGAGSTQQTATGQGAGGGGGGGKSGSDSAGGSSASGTGGPSGKNAKGGNSQASGSGRGVAGQESSGKPGGQQAASDQQESAQKESSKSGNEAADSKQAGGDEQASNNNQPGTDDQAQGATPPAGKDGGPSTKPVATNTAAQAGTQADDSPSQSEQQESNSTKASREQEERAFEARRQNIENYMNSFQKLIKIAIIALAALIILKLLSSTPSASAVSDDEMNKRILALAHARQRIHDLQRKKYASRRIEVIAAYHAYLALLASKGIIKLDWQTPNQFLAEGLRLGEPLRGFSGDLTSFFSKVYYGQAELTDDEYGRFRKFVGKIVI